MGLFNRSKKEDPLDSLFEDKEEKIKCDNCGEDFVKSEMRKCKKCGAVLCPECRKNHVCSSEIEEEKPLTESGYNEQTTVDEEIITIHPYDSKCIRDREFSCNKRLIKIIIPDSVTSIGDYAFSGCKNLEEIVIPNSVTSIRDSAFSDCYKLKKIIIPDSVTSIGIYAFSSCKNLKEVIISSSVTSIGNDVFYGCTDLIIYSPFGSNIRESYNYKLEYPTFQLGSNAYFENTSQNDISGKGWYWNDATKEIILNNYEGGAIYSLNNISVVLAPDSKNLIYNTKEADVLAGIQSVHGSIKIQGKGELKIEGFDLGVSAHDSIELKSGTVTAVGNIAGIETETGKTTISGGTLHSTALYNENNCFGIIGRLQCENARIFAGDSQTTARKTEQYLKQRYVCVTFDENCNMDSSTVLKQKIVNIENIAEGAQVVAGDNLGAVIGAEAIVNRSNVLAGRDVDEDTVVNKQDDSGNIEEQEFKYCIYCGTKLPVEAIFCMKCGKRLKEN